MPALFFVEGDQNSRGQILVARPFPGAVGDMTWKVCCCYCGFEYETLACDFQEHPCPSCQREQLG